MVEKLFPDSFLIHQNWAYLRINCLKFCTVWFYCVISWGLSNYIKTKLQVTGFLPQIKPFFKKKGFGISFPASFSDQILLSGKLYFVGHGAICVLLLFVNQFVVFPFFLHKKSRQKFKYLENEKTFYDEMKSIFQRTFIEADKTNFWGRWD